MNRDNKYLEFSFMEVPKELKNVVFFKNTALVKFLVLQLEELIKIKNIVIRDRDLLEYEYEDIHEHFEKLNICIFISLTIRVFYKNNTIIVKGINEPFIRKIFLNNLEKTISNLEEDIEEISKVKVL